MRRRRYATDLSDAEYAWLALYLLPPRSPGQPRLRPWREILNGNFYMRGSRQNAATPQRCYIPSAKAAELEPEYSPVFPVLTFHGSLVRSRDSELTGIRIAIYERLFEHV
jgi:hypothetical protein